MHIITQHRHAIIFNDNDQIESHFPSRVTAQARYDWLIRCSRHRADDIYLAEVTMQWVKEDGK